MRTLWIFSFIAVASLSQASQHQIEAVKASPMISAIKLGLQAEQGLNCDYLIEESGEESIIFFTEDHRSKFQAGLLCSNGQTAIIKGILGDGGQTVVEEFRMSFAN